MGDAQPGHELRQSLPRQSEFTRRLHPSPTAAREGGANEVLLEESSRLMEPPRIRNRPFGEHRRQRRHRHDAATAGADDQRGQYVLQLSNVARPVVLGEGGKHRRA